MQITVKSTTRESKQAQGKTYWGVKHEDGNWYNVITNDKPTMGQRFEADVKETQFNNRTYRWATPIGPKQATTGNNSSNGHIAWEDYRTMAEAAHELAGELEPDDREIEPGEDGNKYYVKLDRSAARAAILNTVMIAFANGKIALPK